MKRKDSILIDAIDLLDYAGIKGLTTKKLADLQHITEPAIYRQYDSKLDILMHIIKEYSLYDEQIMNTIVENKMSAKEGLFYYIKRFLEIYENYPEITTLMFSFDAYRYNETLNNQMKTVLKNRLNFLETIIQKGITNKELTTDYTAENLAMMINGLIYSTTYQWRMFSDFTLTDRCSDIFNELIK